MRRPPDLFPEPIAPAPADGLARALGRVAGSPLRAGNAARLLKDGRENYPAWLAAIEGARDRVHFENFIVANDSTGRLFAEAFAAKARQGVAVRVSYDWLGSAGRAWPGFWRGLREAGVEVRAFNPPRLSSPLWVRRTHRKLLTVDGALGFVSGLCVSDQWRGDLERGIEPWRDTGVAFAGPAVLDLDAAFAETWSLSGPPLPPSETRPLRPQGQTTSASGEGWIGGVPARIVAGRPGRLALYRLDQLVAAAARRRLWLTDAYFVATAAYTQALIEAARDGVDVRLLVPGTSDVPFFQNVVRGGYRPLVEAGVRVFEWTGSMLHAKTAVVDGRWSRIGSTNLNPTSWMTNWELDAVLEDEAFAGRMEAMYLADLERSKEVVLDQTARAGRGRPRLPRRMPSGPRAAPAAMARLAGGALGFGRMAGAAIGGTRSLTRAEAASVARIGLALLALAALITLFPVVVISPVVIMLVWLGVALLLKARRAKRLLAAIHRRRAALRSLWEAPARSR